MTNCPNIDQYVAVSFTTSPVTHTAEVEVNIASRKGVIFPLADDMGSIRSIAPKIIAPANPKMII